MLPPGDCTRSLCPAHMSELGNAY